MMDVQEIRHRAARGENLTSGELLEIADQLDRLEDELQHTTLRLDQKSTQVNLMQAMNDLALSSAAQARTVQTMRAEVTGQRIKRDSQLYNAFEVRQVIHALDHSEQQRSALVKTHEKLLRQCTAAIGLEQMISAIDSDDVRPFAFQDVASLLAAHRSSTSLGRPVRTNVREIFQLLKAQPDALFHGQEVALVRKWGSDHDRNCSIVKARLGRAFTDPVGYLDPKVDMMLSKATKRQLLDGKVINQQSFQHAVFARPSFLTIDKDWTLCDGRTQFHAGDYFHTVTDSGKWWCAQHFSDLSGYELMQILETALGELRLLYVHYPNGVSNEAE